MRAKLIGIGVGPGDPELLTLKAVRTLQNAKVVAHFAKNGNSSNARAVVTGHLRPDVIELEFFYPVTTEIPHHSPKYCSGIAEFYNECASKVAAHLAPGISLRDPTTKAEMRAVIEELGLGNSAEWKAA